jgi:large subunit ribosomal protein L17
MKHRVVTRTLGRRSGHRIMMLRNLATSLFKFERIETTEVRAKELSKFAENIITDAKGLDLASKRKVFEVIKDREVAKKLFEVIAPKYENRAGGFTRIIKLGFRKGDGAPVALIELV